MHQYSWAQPSARRPRAAPGGYKLAGPWGARRTPARTHALGPGTGKSGGGPSTLATPPSSRSRAPAASRSPRFSQVPMVASTPRKSHSESFVRQTGGPALGTAPARGPWGFRHQGTLRRQTPTSEHARFRARNGEERGRTQQALNPATLPLKSPQKHRVHPASVKGPWSTIAVARCPLAGGPTAPYRADPVWPHIVCSGSMRLCENGGPPPLPFQEGRRRISRARPAGAARLRMGTLEEESARKGDSNPGCNYPVRGYSPSMHFFWGGDMPHYSPPLTFRRGRAGFLCMVASSRGRPARGSQTCTLAGVPRPAPRVAAAYMRAGRRARVEVVRAGWHAQAQAPGRCQKVRTGRWAHACARRGGRRRARHV